MPTEIELLQARRKELWNALKSSHFLLVRAHKLCESLEARYNHDKALHAQVDYQLALLDGRLHIVEPAEKKRKVTVADLTEEQIIQIALELGIKLPGADEEKEEESA